MGTRKKNTRLMFFIHLKTRILNIFLRQHIVNAVLPSTLINCLQKFNTQTGSAGFSGNSFQI